MHHVERMLFLLASGALMVPTACKRPQSSEATAAVATTEPLPAAAASTSPSPAASPMPAVPSPPAVLAPTPSASSGAGPGGGRWTFDANPVGAPPPGFELGRTGQGKAGRWVVEADDSAPSKPNVLAQVEADPTDYRFPVAVVSSVHLKDLSLSVACKPVSGNVDQACGLVFRYRDADNYYITRANALEDNVRLYRVKAGSRQQIASWSGKVASKVWHTLRADARGDKLEVYFDGRKVIDAKDSTFGDAGKIGVWTKADTVTHYDDLAVSPL